MNPRVNVYLQYIPLAGKHRTSDVCEVLEGSSKRFRPRVGPQSNSNVATGCPERAIFRVEIAGNVTGAFNRSARNVRRSSRGITIMALPLWCHHNTSRHETLFPSAFARTGKPAGSRAQPRRIARRGDRRLLRAVSCMFPSFFFGRSSYVENAAQTRNTHVFVERRGR
jgi:hypothetical protein